MSITKKDLIEALKHLIYGSQGTQLQQKTGTYELLTEDTGAHIREALREELASRDILMRLSNWSRWPTAVIDLGSAGAWDDTHMFRGFVLVDGDRYNMYYHASNAIGVDAIGLATSQDGIIWEKYAGNPILSGTGIGSGTWEEDVGMCSVIKVGGIYYMYYVGFDVTGLQRIGVATSGDGIAWSKSGGNPIVNFGASWESRSVGESPFVLRLFDKWVMYYCGWDGTYWRIGRAESDDGFKWTKYAGNPVLDVGSSGTPDDRESYTPIVFKIGGKWFMIYVGYGFATPSVYRYTVCLATSDDGFAWNKQGVVMDSGSPGAFDQTNIHMPCTILGLDGRFKMWYAGYDNVNWRLGFAESSLETDRMSKALVFADLRDLNGTLNIFEDDQPIGTTPTHYIELNSPVKKFILEDVRYRFEAANDVTFQLYLLEDAQADDLTSRSNVVYDSGSLKARNADYNEVPGGAARVPIPVDLATPRRLYYLIDWSAAPGNTPGYIIVRGKKLERYS